MPYLRSFGAYIPRYRLGKETAGWGTSAQKAVANFDEDSITMAVAAGREALRGLDPREIDALYFATTTPPYTEQQNSAIIAEALDLRRDIFASDITNVLRAGTLALKTALDAVQSGSARNALVVAADCRITAPRGELERNLGDGASAVVVSRDGGVAEVLGTHFRTEYMLDTWRPPDERFVKAWESRFILEEGYQRILAGVATEAAQRWGVSPADFRKVVLVAPDARQHQAMVGMLGFKPEQAQDPLYGKVGNTGSAYALMMLVGALETAQPGERILVLDYGDGASVLDLRVTEAIRSLPPRRGVRKWLEAGTVLPSYEIYQRWRNVWEVEPARRPPTPMPSVVALWRERDQNIRLHGARCEACGYTQYPPQAVCTKCRSRGPFTPVRLADRRAYVFTYSMDYLAGTVDIPLVVAVLNFEGGGRMLAMMTDREISEVRVEMPVEMTFRRLFTVGGLHNYYWKCMPVRAEV